MKEAAQSQKETQHANWKASADAAESLRSGREDANKAKYEDHQAWLDSEWAKHQAKIAGWRATYAAARVKRYEAREKQKINWAEAWAKRKIEWSAAKAYNA